MNLYEAIYSRRSVRKYLMEPVEHKILDELVVCFEELMPLFADIKVRIEIINSMEKKLVKGAFSVKAPYYLAFYSEKKEKYLLNAGYIMEQLSLFLTTKGIGSCFLGGAQRKKEKNDTDDCEFLIIMAFGKPEGSHTRKEKDAKRLSLDELCVYKEQPRNWVNQILGAARIAPSSMNSQPWRFVVYENRIHIFNKKPRLPISLLNRLNEFDFGIMLSNIMIVAEEIWVDIDLIKLDNVSHKQVPNNQYVISVILKP